MVHRHFLAVDFGRPEPRWRFHIETVLLTAM